MADSWNDSIDRMLFGSAVSVTFGYKDQDYLNCCNLGEDPHNNFEIQYLDRFQNNFSIKK